MAQAAAGRGRGRCSKPGSGGGAAHSPGPLSSRTAGSSHFFQPPAGSGLDSDCSARLRDEDLGPLSRAAAAGCAGSITQRNSCESGKQDPRVEELGEFGDGCETAEYEVGHQRRSRVGARAGGSPGCWSHRMTASPASAWEWLRPRRSGRLGTPAALRICHIELWRWACARTRGFQGL